VTPAVPAVPGPLPAAPPVPAAPAAPPVPPIPPAAAVGIGRPYAYGAALGGVDGIVHVLRSILAEADLTMAIDGYPALKDLTPQALRRVRR
jgi:lactate 2-monooxygenase